MLLFTYCLDGVYGKIIVFSKGLWKREIYAQT